ncbi:MAG: DUF805 domain-containing protein [Alphaproteobacteria bacterium]|nr:DUF805 domain-containing protein [Alphaproteobacteria bacterium]MDA8002464.1 DUF805 domain-containing protein [Alphaproteobacteria bacterium]MDA8003658.1 DUF805 domain-containing protein [Alphaproteobacteria bacterium]MDA8004934.1 DUF805 domain-containing protein [Alphaproteobacteria bacterium]MDA8009892.1 DUF805 domain-containing protein [Alphaproteobacteria bacterium]
MRVHEIFERSLGHQERFGGFFVFGGRAPRSEYLSGTIILFLSGFLFSLLVHVIYTRCGRPVFCSYVLSPLYAFNVALLVFLVLAMLCQRIRRFHDFGVSGLFAILTAPFVPFILWAYFTWPQFSHIDGLLPHAPSFYETRLVRGVLFLVLGVFVLLPFIMPGNRRGEYYDLEWQARTHRLDVLARDRRTQERRKVRGKT